MGSCVCKYTSDDESDLSGDHLRRSQSQLEGPSSVHVSNGWVIDGGNKYLSEVVDKLVTETLDIIAKISGK